MTYQDLITDPKGIIIFNEPTDLRATTGISHSMETVSVLPYTELKDFEDDDPVYSQYNQEAWAGRDSFLIPAEADYTLVTGLEIDSNIDTEPIGGDIIDLNQLVATP